MVYIYYNDKDGNCPFTVEGNTVLINFPVAENVMCESVDLWKSTYDLKIPDNIIMKVIGGKEVEFYKETITLSGISMDSKTGALTVTMDGLETVLAWIPARNIQFINTHVEEMKEDDKAVINE